MRATTRSLRWRHGRYAVGGSTVQTVKVGDKAIGDGEPCFIIAEAGVNHNGSVELAKKLIDVAVKADADAIKFQTFRAVAMTTRQALKATYQQETTGDDSQRSMLRALELTSDEFKELYHYANEVGILFLSSPFDLASVDLLRELGVTAYKIGSGEITNRPLLLHVVEQEKPIILSTGICVKPLNKYLACGFYLSLVFRANAIDLRLELG